MSLNVLNSCDSSIFTTSSPLLQLTAEKLGAKPEECIFLDDLIKNCEGAEAVGMTSIQVCSLAIFGPNCEFRFSTARLTWR